MSGSFYDSNVVLYTYDDVDGHKRQIARQLIAGGLAEQSGTISFQVVQEVLNALNHKLGNLIQPEDIQQVFDDILVPLWNVMPSEQLYRAAQALHHRYRYAFYDSLIIAAALEADAEFLYTEDLQHGQRIEQTTIINPFL